VPRLRARVARAAALHRGAAAVAAAAAGALDGYAPASAPRERYAEQHDLAARLRAAAHELAPGWLGAALDAQTPATPLGDTHPPEFVRVGQAHPLDDARFPVVVPLLGAGHLAVDADVRDPRVAGLLRSLVLRLLAATPAGSLHVRVVDPAGGGVTFALFRGLEPVMPPAATDRGGLHEVLGEAERWVRQPPGDGRMMLVVVTSLPELTDGGDLARVAALAQAGPPAHVHLVVAGWPPPPLTAETTQAPLPQCTQVTLRNPYAWVGDPPGTTFAASALTAAPGTPRMPARLNAPAYLDPDPPAELVRRVCGELAAQLAARSRLGVADLLEPGAGVPDGGAATARVASPHPSTDGLSTVVGRTGEEPAVLRFDDATPHWMVGGRSGSGKTAFLLDVLYGLCSRYGRDELALYLLDFKEGVSFSELVPTSRDPAWLPQARAVGIESDREYGLAVLRELDAEMTRRSVAYKEAGVTRFADLRRAGVGAPRALCVVDEFQVLLSGADALAREATALLESLARKGRSYGIHLVLCSQTVRGVEALYAKRDSIFGQFPLRVALPGGGDVLDPMRPGDPAATLPVGTAIVNTAGGAAGHDVTVRFPDPYADPGTLTGLRHRLWQARPPGSAPPAVFAGHAPADLAGDPVYASFAARAADADATPLPADRPARALLGRAVDVARSTVSFALERRPGRHVAVLGPDPAGAAIVAAAVQSIAVQHRPGTARFLLAPLVPEALSVAADLEASLAGHDVGRIEAGELAAALAAQPAGDGVSTYLVGFGLDAAGRGGFGALRDPLHDGPGRGAHLIGWWRALRPFVDDIGGTAGREAVACLVLTNVPATDASLLLGQPVEWRPRPNRALVHDAHTGLSTPVVPFVHIGRSR
jgi:DNA segregation ATPase FtsK/SpoIIIE, S-DNA-T family